MKIPASWDIIITFRLCETLLASVFYPHSSEVRNLTQGENLKAMNNHRREWYEMDGESSNFKKVSN